MVCFVRDISTWSHIAQCDVETYDVPIFSVDDSNGTIRVIGEYPELSKNWIIFQGFLFYLEKASPDEGFTDFTVSRPMNAFERDLVYTGNGAEVLESFIVQELGSNYISQADAMYAMPYLSVYSLSETNVELSYATNEVYSFGDILDLAEEKKINFSFVMDESGLSLYIFASQGAFHNLFFEDGHNFLESATLSDEIVSKVTVRKIQVSENDEITVISSEDYFWHSDGSISTTAPNPRIKGTWEVVSVYEEEDSEEDVALAAAEEAMEDNSEANKIEFRSDKVLTKWDTIVCSVKGRLIAETLTSCRIDSDNPLFLYELGSMPTTLTQKVSSYNYTKQTTPIAYELQEDEYLSQYGGTVGGDTVYNSSLSAQTLIVGEGSYGSALPATGVLGQVFFKI